MALVMCSPTKNHLRTGLASFVDFYMNICANSEGHVRLKRTNSEVCCVVLHYSVDARDMADMHSTDLVFRNYSSKYLHKSLPYFFIVFVETVYS